MAAKNTPKTFSGSAKNKGVKKDPITFELEGETIEAYPTVDGWTSLEFYRGVSSEEPSEKLGAVMTYIEASFDNKNKKLFLSAVKNPENGYELDDIVDIMNYLVEERSAGRDLAESSE